VVGRTGRIVTEPRRESESFERETGEIARARRFVARTLRTWELQVEIPDLVLLVSELVSNALLHGAGTISVDIAYEEGLLRLDVTDQGGTSLPHLETGELGGRGLRLVDLLADAWGVEKNARETRVWFVKRT
jgi:anti-sigma regulatory factor (Ser/Thr protein kinase)